MFLFVYGTLRKGFPGEMAQKLSTEAEWIGKALLQNAQLYRVHWENFHFDYPALVLIDEKTPNKCDSFVVGDLVHLKNAEQSIKWLDAYEECGEQFNQPNEYIRKEVTVQLMTDQEASQNFLASTYVYGWPIKDSNGNFVAPVREIVVAGDWLKFVQKTVENYAGKPLIHPHVRPCHPSLL
ncbi:hypothetical protein niasHT_027231 [Heterodera trifolii]|uniref:Gamma-glutamylcyclotransferase AIG2-like domain-containing protein n=1 Tax=Heterodera trifolii TaxID=157864 RepID=A0ABD2JGL2_9BILA